MSYIYIWLYLIHFIEKRSITIELRTSFFHEQMPQVYQLVVPLNPGELLVVDNRANAHGRRPYESGDPRIMWRKNYVGNGDLEAQLNTGMCAAFSSMFDGLHSMFDPMSIDASKLKIWMVVQLDSLLERRHRTVFRIPASKESETQNWDQEETSLRFSWTSLTM